VSPPLRRTRAELASILGAHLVLSTEEDVEGVMDEQTNGQGVDCVVDCTGSPDAINEGIRLLRKDGKLVALGISLSQRIPFEYNVAVLNALRIIFSCSSSGRAWTKALGVLQRHHDDVEKIITHRFPLEEWEEAYRVIASREAVKAVLHSF